MRMLLPTVAVVALGCASETALDGRSVTTGVVNPRPLGATTQLDRIVQVARPEVDVLWVLDDSATMYWVHDELAQNFPRFFDYFEGSGMDYHIGVVATAVGDRVPWSGHLITRNGFRYVDPETPDAETVFAQMVWLENQHSSLERGHDATYAALETEKHDYNLGFLRERSGVHIIVVADSPDRSTITPAELAEYLNGLREDPDGVTHSSILNLGHEPTYTAVTEKVGGAVWSLQDPDWTGMLEQLGMQSAGLKLEYFLSKLPVPGTIEVSVVDGGAELGFFEGEDWAYDPVRNSITFHTYAPNHLAEVVLEYEVLGSHHGA